MPPNEIELKDFALRVERLCDFFLDRKSKEESADIRVLEDLKNDAADIQFDRQKVKSLDMFTGLADYMKGAP